MPQFIIDYTAPQGVRVAAAFGKLRGYKDAQGVARSATAAEVRAELVEFIKNVTGEQERAAARQAADAALTDLGIT